MERDYFTVHINSMGPYRALLRAVECKFMGRVPLRPPVLDIGCGDGHFASIVYPGPIEVGLDISIQNLKEALTRSGVYRLLIQAEAPALPFPDRYFATVVSNCTIEHVPHLDGTLVEIARVLQPGGTFAFTVPSEHFPEFLLFSSLARKLGLNFLADFYGRLFNRISDHYHVYPPEVWDMKLDGAGFDVIKHFYYFSEDAHKAFDLSHYIGVWIWAFKKVAGRWVIPMPLIWALDRWLRRYYEEPLPEAGAYQFVHCKKRG